MIESLKRNVKILTGPKVLGPSYPTLPQTDEFGESTIPGLYIKGDAVGRPLIKIGLNDGFDIANHLKTQLGSYKDKNDYDTIIVGSGATGFAAANQAHELGLRYLMLESERFCNLIKTFTKGKPLFSEPHNVPQKGAIWFEECKKEELVEKWEEHRQKINLNIHEYEKVLNIEGEKGAFRVITASKNYTSSFIILAIGKSGNPRKAGVPGEIEYPDKIHHFLADPDVYQDKNILIYGGGDVAAEAALVLCDHNKVTLATIDPEFIFPKKRNADAMLAKEKENNLNIHFDTKLSSITREKVVIEDQSKGTQTSLDNDVVFEMIGAELPLPFFNKIGIKLENKWYGNMWTALAVGMVSFLCLGAWAHGVGLNSGAVHTYGGGLLFLASMTLLGFLGKKGNRWAWLACAMLLSYSIYAGKSNHFPFHYIGADRIADYLASGILGLFVPTAIIALKGAPAFWYTVLYTILVVYFGLKARKRWGTDSNDDHQKLRYMSIIAFQVVFFIVVNMILSVLIGKYYWRGWGLYQPFPLFYNTFFWWYPGDPASIKYFFIGFGLFLTFICIPIFVRYHGMRFCTWVCGCGGLAETFGDMWRHLSPKGPRSQKWEFAGPLIVVWAFLSLLAIAIAFKSDGNNMIWSTYNYVVDFWLVAVIPIGLYPFFGGKVWCRYWCPLAHYMKIFSSWFGKLQISSNEKCISCTQCSTYCQVGVDVMAFAKNQQSFDNKNSSCIHCGICITVCPMNVLAFETKK